MKNESQKALFAEQLRRFASTLPGAIARKGEWTVRGFIDIFKKIHPLSSDTKLISKVLELHLFPLLFTFADQNGYDIIPADKQNYYPDLSFVSKKDTRVKFAVDLKTTLKDEKKPEYCNGFTLGSHGNYFENRESHKNIQFPYSEYSGHFCLGIIYSQCGIDRSGETKIYEVNEVGEIPAVIANFIFFAEEKWKIASDKQGSWNTANIGSVKKIDDLLTGNGVFAKAGEELFDDYWINYGKITIKENGVQKKIVTFADYLRYRRLPPELNNSGVKSGVSQ